MKHHNEQDFPSKYISEQTKRKREKLREFTDKFQKPYHCPEHVWLVKRTHKEFFPIPEKSQCCNACKLYRQHYHKGKCQRKIKIG